MTTPQHENQVYCSRCRRYVPLDDCSLRIPQASAGLQEDYGPSHVYVIKHKACKELIFMPGRAPVDGYKRIG